MESERRTRQSRQRKPPEPRSPRRHCQPITLSVHLGKYHDIRQNRDFSNERLEEIRRRFRKAPALAKSGITCVAVCGSYARLEASESSDLDVLIITQGNTNCGRMRKHLEQELSSLRLPLPNQRGVFASDCEEEDLLALAGSPKETYETLSRRLLLLLESRPLLASAAYDKLVRRIVLTYAKDVKEDATKNFVYLLNDLIRYFRTICVNYQHSKDTEWGKWPIRNIKLRHSR